LNLISTTFKNGPTGLLVSRLPCPIVLHLNCEGRSEDDYVHVLSAAHQLGIYNLLIVRGDGYEKASASSSSDRRPIFSSVLDLLAFIRRRFSGQFCVGVPVYPSDSSDERRLRNAIDWLKLKVNVGAEFIVTQAISDYEEFKRFVTELRNQGIDLPTFAGLLPISNSKTYLALKKFGKCGLDIVNEDAIRLCHANDDHEGILQASLDGNVNVAERCLHDQSASALHIFTLNNIAVTVKLVQSVNLSRTTNEQK
jgi:methylenetetrahydrofolate reductase (NADPH)